MREPVKPVVNTWNCVNCAGQIAVKSGATLVVACPYCGSIVDAKDPNHQLLAEYDRKLVHKPVIPLGARGTVRGELYECIGFCRRQVVVEGTPYTWSEYLLWHPQRGYRWLSEYGRHWTYLKPCTGLPQKRGIEVKFLDRTYKRFQGAEATTTFALGEFNWQVRRGEKSQVADYIAPPYILSEDKADNEVNWTLGEYIDSKEIWAAFKLPGEPPAAQGIAPAQPSPYDAMAPSMNKLFGLFLGLLVLMQALSCMMSPSTLAHQESFTINANDKEKVRVSKQFLLDGRTQNVEVQIETNADNNWASFECALISPDHSNPDVIEFVREVEMYHGVEDGESWSEGDRNDTVILGSVPPGKWNLRFEPDCPMPQLTWTVRVYRGVPRYAWFFWAAILLCVPYLFFLWRRRTFEYNRWIESDAPMRPLLKFSSEDDE